MIKLVSHISAIRFDKTKNSIINISLLTLLLSFLFACNNSKTEQAVQEHPNITKLKGQSAEFIPEIIQLRKDLYVAVGFDGSNASMVIGDDGVVIIDALRALGAAEKVAKLFREITDKPVKALIYTHGHQDHTGGSSAFIADSKNVKIIAREGFKEELEENSPVQAILKQRNARQFGRELPTEDIINRGVAPGITSKDRAGKGYIKPNITFQEYLEVNLAGIDFELYASNGETNDQLFVWCPSKASLFPGDNYYKAFPNLYAIRGSQYRDVKSWGESIHKMSTFPVEYLIPGHTRPLSGKKLIHTSLTDYSAAILSVYKQTINAMNKGFTLQETVDVVNLPDSLKDKANLQEFYGSVQWGVRSIFTHYVGWFDGNPTQLYPLSSKKEAINMIALAGGEKAMLDKIKATLQSKNYQWGLQLVDYLLQANVEIKTATKIKIELLRGLAAQQINAPARNYYLSYAYELEKTDQNL